MGQEIDAFATFKHETVAMPRRPSTTLVLSAQPQERETPIPATYMSVDHDLREHHKRFDAALITTSDPGLRAALFLAVLIIILGWAFSLYLVWRMR